MKLRMLIVELKGFETDFEVAQLKPDENALDAARALVIEANHQLRSTDNLAFTFVVVDVDTNKAVERGSFTL